MATITLDTHSFVKRLTQAGMPEQQAEAIAGEIQSINLEQVATKQDIDSVRQEISHQTSHLEVRFSSEIRKLLMWLVPLLLGQAALTAALVRLI